MSENSDAPNVPMSVQVGGDVSGILVVGDKNTVSHTVTKLKVTAKSGAQVTVNTGPVPIPAKRPRISQLPRSSPSDPLIGREDDVERLRQAIETESLVHIWGPSGIGKSALLRHLARTLPRGSEGVAYIEAHGRTVNDLAQAIFDISFDAPNLKPSLEVIKEHLKTLHLRIYLDDAGLAENELRQLFDLAPESTFVFTAERKSAVGGAQSIRLDGLTALAATELMRVLMHRALQPDEEQAVTALRDAVDGNPLRLRRIASSAVERLPGTGELSELLPALVRGLSPQEGDLLHLLASMFGAGLCVRQLNDLLGRQDAADLGDALVRCGLLLASETGYSCPPDVAECVLTQHATEYPADHLCERLTAWVDADDTTPDDVAAHFQALDAAVLRAEAAGPGHAAAGVALARAASPKLAASRQFDAWGCLLGAGWTAATTAKDRAGKEFFLRSEGARNKALGKSALAAVLLTEAAVLGRETSALLHTQSVPQPIAGTAAPQPMIQPNPVSPASNPAASGHMANASHPAHVSHAAHAAHLAHISPVAHAVAASHAAASVSVAAPAANPAGVNLGIHALQQSNLSSAHAAAHMGTTSAQAAVQSPPHIGLTAAGGSHTGIAAAIAAAVKGAPALVISCVIGFVAVAGVGAAVYANEQPNSAASTTSPSASPTQNVPAATSFYVDPTCGTVLPDLNTEGNALVNDGNAITNALNAYNTAMDNYNAGSGSEPSPGALNSSVGAMISELQTMESTVQNSGSAARDGNVITALSGLSSATKQMTSAFQSYDASQESYNLDVSSETDQLTTDYTSLYTACYGI